MARLHLQCPRSARWYGWLLGSLDCCCTFQVFEVCQVINKPWLGGQEARYVRHLVLDLFPSPCRDSYTELLNLHNVFWHGSNLHCALWQCQVYRVNPRRGPAVGFHVQRRGYAKIPGTFPTYASAVGHLLKQLGMSTWVGLQMPVATRCTCGALHNEVAEMSRVWNVPKKDLWKKYPRLVDGMQDAKPIGAAGHEEIGSTNNCRCFFVTTQYICVYIYAYIYMCICVYICIYVYMY